MDEGALFVPADVVGDAGVMIGVFGVESEVPVASLSGVTPPGTGAGAARTRQNSVTGVSDPFARMAATSTRNMCRSSDRSASNSNSCAMPPYKSKAMISPSEAFSSDRL